MAAIPALTLHRPWPGLIFFAGKDIENRSWTTRYRGPLYIHAGKTWDDDALDFAARIPIADGTSASNWVSHATALHPTGIVGVVDLVDVIEAHTSPWAVPGQYHWCLENRRVFILPVPCRGMQGLWHPPVELRDQLVSP